MRTTPFHELTGAANETGLWSHRAGHTGGCEIGGPGKLAASQIIGDRRTATDV
jgi:hypothetical protein